MSEEIEVSYVLTSCLLSKEIENLINGNAFFNDTEAGTFEKEDIINLDHFLIPLNLKYIIEGDCFLNENNLTGKGAIS